MTKYLSVGSLGLLDNRQYISTDKLRTTRGELSEIDDRL